MANDGKFLIHILLSCDYAIEDIANQLWHSVFESRFNLWILPSSASMIELLKEIGIISKTITTAILGTIIIYHLLCHILYKLPYMDLLFNFEMKYIIHSWSISPLKVDYVIHLKIIKWFKWLSKLIHIKYLQWFLEEVKYTSCV